MNATAAPDLFGYIRPTPPPRPREAPRLPPGEDPADYLPDPGPVPSTPFVPPPLPAAEPGLPVAMALLRQMTELVSCGDVAARASPSRLADWLAASRAVIAQWREDNPFNTNEMAAFATENDLADPAFVAVARAMHGWMIAFPGVNVGTTWTNSAHVNAVLRALRSTGQLPSRAGA